MNRDDIIRMAREALNQRVDYTIWTLSTPHLEAFADLVAAAEREACAMTVANIAGDEQYRWAAMAIRERGAP